MSQPPEASDPSGKQSLLPWPVATFPAGGPAGMPQHLAPLVRADQPWASIAGAGAKPSAVIMLFIPPAAPDTPCRVVLTRRSTAVRTHKAQIAFAGGRAEIQDGTPAVTALRELEEELGLPQHRVHVFGMLPVAQALTSIVVPVVGFADCELRELQPSAAEVQTVFADPWTTFAANLDRPFRFNLFGNWRSSHLFFASGGNVWGFTAQVLAQAALA